MICFWKTMNIRSIGAATMVEAAIMYCQDDAYWLRKLAIPTCTTHRSWLLVTVSGRYGWGTPGR